MHANNIITEKLFCLAAAIGTSNREKWKLCHNTQIIIIHCAPLDDYSHLYHTCYL